MFTHGRNFAHGGWFDTRAGKPVVQVRRDAASDWLTVGELADYPATTGTQGDDLQRWWMDARFTLVLPQPVQLVAVRVLGTPAGGNQPQQAFASCTELQAYA